MFAGLLAEQSAGAGEVGLTTFCVVWMLCRIIYTVNYLMVETKTWSYLRSLTFFASTAWAFTVIGRSAFVLGK